MCERKKKESHGVIVSVHRGFAWTKPPSKAVFTKKKEKLVLGIATVKTRPVL